MPHVFPVTFLLAASALLASHGAGAQSLVGDVRACRQMPDPTSRLTCYDAMKLPSESAATSAAAAPPAAAAPVAVDQVARFGQEALRSPAGTPELKRIESRIRGKFEGWGPNSRLEFENGQIWRIADGSEAYYQLQDPQVIVHRGLLGAFYLQIEGVGFNVRVVRVR